MGQTLAKADHGGAVVPAQLVDAARGYAAQAKAAATRRAYRSDLRAFVAWCDAQGVEALPAEPDTVALYLTDRALAGTKVSTLERALAAISEAHKAAGQGSPRSQAVVQAVLRGIRRARGVARREVAPALVSDLRTMIASLPENVLGLRDRALLLVGFAGAFRRSELVALDMDAVAFTTDGLELTLRRSKTDQEGEGRKIGVPYGSSTATCPVRTLKAWLEAAVVTVGPVFRRVTRHGRVGAARLSDRSVARIVKRAAKAAGLDPARYSGHSLRAGLVTSAAKAGKPERVIMAQTGHRSAAMLRRYIRDASLFVDNAVSGLL